MKLLEHLGLGRLFAGMVMLADDMRGAGHRLPLHAVAFLDVAFVVAPVAIQTRHSCGKDPDDPDQAEHFGPAAAEDDWMTEERGDHFRHRGV